MADNLLTMMKSPRGSQTPDPGDILFADGSQVWQRLTITDDRFLKSASGVPTWGTITPGDLPSHNHAAGDITSGTLGVARGGTGLASFTQGDLIYASGATTLSKLPTNATGTRQFLRSVSGGNPAWDTLEANDIPDLSGSYLPLAGGTLTGDLTLVGDPSASNHAATKGYVDAVAGGGGLADPKDSARVARVTALPANSRTGNVLTADANGALPSIDGVALDAGDRLLVTAEATGANNGIYEVTDLGDGSNPWVLTRTSDADADSEVTAGIYVWVTEGTVYGDTGWVLTTNDPITVNTTTLSWVQYTGAGQITAGAGLTKTGNTIDIGGGDGITVGADSIALNIGNGLEFAGGAVRVFFGGTGASNQVSRADHTHNASAITAGVLPVARGGTGLGSYTGGDLIYASDGSTLATVGIGNPGEFLKVNGSGDGYEFGTPPSSKWNTTLVPCNAILPNTNPAGAQTVDGSNFTISQLTFGDGGTNIADWHVASPSTYGGGNVRVRIWYKTAATTGDAKFAVQYARNAGDGGSAYDQSLSSESTVVDTVPGVAGRLKATSVDLTSLTAGAGDWVFRLKRLGADVADTAAAEIQVVKVSIEEL